MLATLLLCQNITNGGACLHVLRVSARCGEWILPSRLVIEFTLLASPQSMETVSSMIVKA